MQASELGFGGTEQFGLGYASAAHSGFTAAEDAAARAAAAAETQNRDFLRNLDIHTRLNSGFASYSSRAGRGDSTRLGGHQGHQSRPEVDGFGDMGNIEANVLLNKTRIDAFDKNPVNIGYSAIEAESDLYSLRTLLRESIGEKQRLLVQLQEARDTISNSDMQRERDQAMIRKLYKINSTVHHSRLALLTMATLTRWYHRDLHKGFQAWKTNTARARESFSFLAAKKLMMTVCPEGRAFRQWRQFSMTHLASLSRNKKTMKRFVRRALQVKKYAPTLASQLSSVPISLFRFLLGLIATKNPYTLQLSLYIYITWLTLVFLCLFFPVGTTDWRMDSMDEFFRGTRAGYISATSAQVPNSRDCSAMVFRIFDVRIPPVATSSSRRAKIDETCAA
jgi:hypothetical protein